MTTQLCFNQSEAIELYAPQGLYLKPVAKLNVSVTLPPMRTEGKSISNWEVMEKLKRMARPDAFLVLRVSKSSLEFLRFEAEVEARSLIRVLILRLDGKVIKLSGFPEALKVRAAEAKVAFPSRHDWDSFFRDAKGMNESNPGERPDTVRLEGLPCKWFAEAGGDSPDRPSEQVLRRVFQPLGPVRRVDVPMLDPYRHESQPSGGHFRTFSSFSTLTFEAYVQFAEYIGFVKAMDALKGMKLMKRETEAAGAGGGAGAGEEEAGKDGKAYTADIKVDFDKTRHMSAKAIKKREKERQRLIQLEKEREEQKRLEREEEARKQEEERRRREQEDLYKLQRRQAKMTRREERRQQREERRRHLREERKRERQEQELQRRIALEERKLLIALRQLESIRLLTELFERVKVIKQQEAVQRRLQELERERQRQVQAEAERQEEERRQRVREEARQRRALQRQEVQLKQRLTANLETRRALEEEQRREGLRKSLGGSKARLKSAVVASSLRGAGSSKSRSSSSSKARHHKLHLDDSGGDDNIDDSRDSHRQPRRPKLQSAVSYKHR